jgi:hypothetical protein
MDITFNDLMAKIAQSKRPPVQVRGYFLPHDADPESVRLYPALNPTRYYVIPKKCIVHLQTNPSDPQAIVTVLLDPKCEIECVTRQIVPAGEIAQCRNSKPCRCGTTDTGTLGRYVSVSLVLSIARLLLALGIDHINCFAIGWDGKCCEAWNTLLAAMSSGRSGADEAFDLILDCGGTPE